MKRNTVNRLYTTWPITSGISFTRSELNYSSSQKNYNHRPYGWKISPHLTNRWTMFSASFHLERLLHQLYLQFTKILSRDRPQCDRQAVTQLVGILLLKLSPAVRPSGTAKGKTLKIKSDCPWDHSRWTNKYLSPSYIWPLRKRVSLEHLAKPSKMMNTFDYTYGERKIIPYGILVYPTVPADGTQLPTSTEEHRHFHSSILMTRRSALL